MAARQRSTPQSTRKFDNTTRQDSHQGKTLIDWDQLPEWQRDNEYILSSYRPATFAFGTSLKSVLNVHNETVNIHSHSIGAILFFALPFACYHFVSQQGRLHVSDIIVFSTFFFGVAICFLLSSTFHVFANHSPRINVLGNQLDYLGIVILMWGSTIPSIYYGFLCDPALQRQYWAIISVLAIACVVTTFHPNFRTPLLRPYRALMYAGLGLSAVGFVTHGILRYGRHTLNQRMSLDWMALMATFNLTGATLYAVRFPEKWFPRKFDIWGSSHQLLHVFVIFAALAHMFGLMRAFTHTHAPSFSCSN